MTNRFLVGALLSILLVGCEGRRRANRAKSVPADSASASSGAVEAPQRNAGVHLAIVGWEELTQTIAAKPGKITVVDIWSTSCIPCIREFPHFVELQNKYPNQVVCVSLNIDYIGMSSRPPESYREQVLDFLTKQNATSQNYICSDTDEQIYEKLDLAAVPAVMVYDRSGTLSKRFDNESGEYGDEGFTYGKHIIPFVEKLLAGL